MNENLKRILTSIFAILSLTFGVLSLALDWGQAWWFVWCVALYFIILGNIYLLSYYKKYLKTYKLCVTLLVIGFILAILYAICFYNDWLKYFDSVDTIKNIILSSGGWGILIYFIIQFLQVIIAPIPAMAVTLVGVAIYGPLVASLVSTVAVLSGSILAFFLGRVFGRKVVVWIAGEEQTKKYCDILNKKGKYLLVLMFLFPVFPDDLLCLVAGITSMTFRFFLIASIITRPIGIFVTAYFGSGQLIPYSGWGLYVWPILIILMIVAFILLWKYQDKFEDYLLKKFSKQTIEYVDGEKSNETKKGNSSKNKSKKSIKDYNDTNDKNDLIL